MIRPVLTLSALVALLALSELWLDARAARARAGDSRVGTPFTRAEAENLRKQPALRVEQGSSVATFGRVKGEWRCLSLFGAPADGRAVQALIDGVLSAEGFVRARTVEEAPAYGINTPATLRVSIQGPRATQDPLGDVLATLEIGLAESGREACFVRRLGTKEVWSVAGDLRAPLERRLAPELPPLLASAAVPVSWLEKGGGTVRITVERGGARDGARTVLARRDARDPSKIEPGQPPWTWVLDPDGAASELDTEVAGDFADYLEHLPYVAVLDPEQRAARVATPLATVTLEGRTGEPLVLVFGSTGAHGRVALWVEASATLYEVEPAVLALATPDATALTAKHEQGDPWAAALHPPEVPK